MNFKKCALVVMLCVTGHSVVAYPFYFKKPNYKTDRLYLEYYPSPLHTNCKLGLYVDNSYYGVISENESRELKVRHNTNNVNIRVYNKKACPSITGITFLSNKYKKYSVFIGTHNSLVVAELN